MSQHRIAAKTDLAPDTASTDAVRSGIQAEAQPAAFASPFLSFSFSVTEVTSVGGRTRVQSRTTRLADGRLQSSTFEGELEAGAYERIARQAIEQAGASWRLMMQPFGWLLPARRRGDE